MTVFGSSARTLRTRVSDPPATDMSLRSCLAIPDERLLREDEVLAVTGVPSLQRASGRMLYRSVKGVRRNDPGGR